jgi:hypothetical protein
VKKQFTYQRELYRLALYHAELSAEEYAQIQGLAHAQSLQRSRAYPRHQRTLILLVDKIAGLEAPWLKCPECDTWIPEPMLDLEDACPACNHDLSPNV